MAFCQVEVEEEETSRWKQWEQKPQGKLAGAEGLIGEVQGVARSCCPKAWAVQGV